MNKTYFSEKANVRYTLAGCSRMRVGEGSSEKKEIEKMIKIFKKILKSHPKKEINNKEKPIKNLCEKILKKGAAREERPGTELPPLVPEDIQINKIKNKLTEEKQRIFLTKVKCEG